MLMARCSNDVLFVKENNAVILNLTAHVQPLQQRTCMYTYILNIPPKLTAVSSC